MDTTKIKETQMAKTPEELTESWKAGKLKNGWYFCLYENDVVFPGLCFDDDFDDCQLKVKEVLAPCDYEELQQLKEYERIVTSYAGKPINYDIACETVNKLLDEKEQLKKELKSAHWYQTVQNEDITKLRRLLKECIYILNDYKHCFDVKHHNMTANIIDKANEVLK